MADLMRPDLLDFAITFGFYRQNGVLPEPGGLLDQPATWVAAAWVVLARIAEIEEQRAAERDAATRAASARGRARRHR